MSPKFTLLATAFLCYTPLLAADIDPAVDMTTSSMTIAAVATESKWTHQEKVNVFANVQEQLRSYDMALNEDDVVNGGVLNFSGMLERLSDQKKQHILVILWHLTWIEKLDLSHNGLTLLPAGILAFTDLTELKLYQNCLKTLPVEIIQLKKLKKLNLSDNQLKTLPNEIRSLTELRTLKLYKNQVKTLPQAIGALTKLKNLDLSESRLEKLPPEIGCLVALTSLDLSENRLKTLPAEVQKLSVLEYLDITDNPNFQSEDGAKGEWGSARLRQHFGNNVVFMDEGEGPMIIQIIHDGNMLAHHNLNSQSKVEDNRGWSSSSTWCSYGSALYSGETLLR